MLKFPAVIVPVPTGPTTESPPTIRAAVLPDVVESVSAVVAEDEIVVAPLEATFRTVLPAESFAARRAFADPEAVFCNCRAALPAVDEVALIAVPPVELTFSALFAVELIVVAPVPATENTVLPEPFIAEIRPAAVAVELFFT